MTQLQSYKPADKSKTLPPGKEGDCVMYELYHRPEQAQFSRNAKVIKSLIGAGSIYWWGRSWPLIVW
jgi:hypothetical protein